MIFASPNLVFLKLFWSRMSALCGYNLTNAPVFLSDKLSLMRGQWVNILFQGFPMLLITLYIILAEEPSSAYNSDMDLNSEISVYIAFITTVTHTTSKSRFHDFKEQKSDLITWTLHGQ